MRRAGSYAGKVRGRPATTLTSYLHTHSPHSLILPSSIEARRQRDEHRPPQTDAMMELEAASPACLPACSPGRPHSLEAPSHPHSGSTHATLFCHLPAPSTSLWIVSHPTRSSTVTAPYNRLRRMHCRFATHQSSTRWLRTQHDIQSNTIYERNSAGSI